MNPPEQYADDRNLRARQRFWQHQSPPFDFAGWVLGLAGLSAGMRVLDAGCGNGVYLRALAGRQATPGWQMRRATHAFTAENGAAQLGAAFRSVACVRPPADAPVVIRDAALAADFAASWASFYQHETTRPWPDVVADVRRDVQAVIDQEGAFITSGDLAAFVCR